MHPVEKQDRPIFGHHISLFRMNFERNTLFPALDGGSVFATYIAVTPNMFNYFGKI